MVSERRSSNNCFNVCNLHTLVYSVSYSLIQGKFEYVDEMGEGGLFIYNTLLSVTAAAETMVGGGLTPKLPGIILGMGLANERRRYIVTSSLFDQAHTQYDLWFPSWLTH